MNEHEELKKEVIGKLEWMLTIPNKDEDMDGLIRDIIPRTDDHPIFGGTAYWMLSARIIPLINRLLLDPVDPPRDEETVSKLVSWRAEMEGLTNKALYQLVSRLVGDVRAGVLEDTY